MPEKKSYLLSGLSRYRWSRILYIACFWTIIDIIVCLIDHHYLGYSLLIRAAMVFLMSLVMGYLFVFTLKQVFRESPLWVNFLAKIVIILVAALGMNFLVHFVEDFFSYQLSVEQSVQKFASQNMQPGWLLKRTLYWIVLFIVTQLYIEINDKYSPGVFTDILLGKYIQPKIEKRIIMFIDLKDSTPIAEKLGHSKYFVFIRQFISHVSMSIIEHNGIIYQYVGDEVVVSWNYNRQNMKSCVAAIIEAKKNIQKDSERFRRKFGIVPEFHVGAHVGDVTIGEIGVIKKDLAMSGDTMNTAARIKSACSELNQKFMVSGDFIEKSALEDFQSERLGFFELKGKTNELELFALKI